MKRYRRMAAVILAAASLAACGGNGSDGATSGGDADGLVAAAKKEGKLVFYSVETDAVNTALAKAFQEKYRIQVQTLRLTTGPMLERFAGEQRAGVTNADMIQVVDEGIWKQHPEWFLPLSEDQVPGWSSYPEVARRDRCADMMYSIGGITYNSKLVDSARVPTSYKDMLDPYWKGKLLLTDPRTSPAYMGWAALIEKTHGIEYLKKLREQNFVLVDSATPGAQQVAAGAYYANLMAHLSNSTDLRNKKAPLGFKVMSDPPTGLATCAGIPKNAPHPNAARLFMSWRLTQEAHNAMCEAAELASPVSSADKCVKLPDGWRPTPLDVMSDKAAQQRILQALGIQ